MVSKPQTLTQAHDMLIRDRPSRDASGLTWLRYYRRSAAVYAEVAEIDRGHHHEAMHWAVWERKKANELQAELAKAADRPVIEVVKEKSVKRETGTTVRKEQ
jgi:hypothetical protein